MKFSFIHTADIHLGRAFSDINYTLNQQQKDILKYAHEAALDTLCDYAINNSVDFVLIAGDTFDACEQDLHSRLKLTKVLSRLERNNISVFIICGNHDPASSYTQELEFKNSEKIHIFGVNTEVKKFTLNKENEQIANIYPFSFETKEFPHSPCSILEKASDNSLFNIGLIHCDLGGGQSIYAPCTEKELLELGYDYYALGHIHKPYQNKNIIYSGTPQGRHSKDEGAHGFRHITIENNSIIKNEFVTCDKIRYINLEYSITDYETELEAIQNLESQLLRLSNNCEFTICNLSLTGIRNFSFTDTNELKKELELPSLIVNEITDTTVPNINPEIIKNSGGILAEILNTIENEETLKEVLTQTKKEIADFLKSAENIDDAEILSESISKIKDICVKIYGNEE